MLEERSFLIDRQVAILKQIQDAYAKIGNPSETDSKIQLSQLGDVIRGIQNNIEQLTDSSAQGNFTEELLSSVTSSVIRIGLVLIAIFLIQILVVLARYYYRISDHYSTISAIVQLSAGKNC